MELKLQKSSTYRPEIVDKDVEHAQDSNEDNRAPFGLETNDNHNASNESDHDERHATNGPLARKDKANEQEDQQHATGELEVHFAVLLVELGQAGGGELFAHPAVGKHHEQTAHDAEVAQEEVEVEDEAVTEGLRDDDTDQAHHGVLAVLADDNHERGGDHGDNVDNEEEMRDAAGDCDMLVSKWFVLCIPPSLLQQCLICKCYPPLSVSQPLPEHHLFPKNKQNKLTMPIIMQIRQLIAPLRQNPQRILEESDDNQKAADGRQVRLDGLAECVQPVLDLAGLLADGVERRRVVGRVAARRACAGVEARVLALEVVASGAADRHAGRLRRWWWWWCRWWRKDKEGSWLLRCSAGGCERVVGAVEACGSAMLLLR
jgi:hypothetical protein